MTTPHKHADLIKAWADGAEIEWRNASGFWSATECPGWYTNYEYRIKPAPKPNTVTWHCVYRDKFIGVGNSEIKYAKAFGNLAVLRIEIDHSDPANPTLVSATLEKP